MYSSLKAIGSPYLSKAPEALFWTHSLQLSLYFVNGKAGVSSKVFMCVRKEKKKKILMALDDFFLFNHYGDFNVSYFHSLQ